MWATLVLEVTDKRQVLNLTLLSPCPLLKVLNITALTVLAAVFLCNLENIFWTSVL